MLDELAGLARDLLHVDRAGVVLIDEPAQSARVVSFAGNFPPNPRTVFPLSTLPTIAQCLRSGQIVFDRDMRLSTATTNQDIVREFDAAAVILIPLRVEAKSLGLLALSDSHPRDFTGTERQLASLLGTQASVILANHTLYEQTRLTLEVHKQLLEQQDKLYAVNAAVYSAPTFRQSLQAVADQRPTRWGSASAPFICARITRARWWLSRQPSPMRADLWASDSVLRMDTRSRWWTSERSFTCRTPRGIRASIPSSG